MALAPRAGLTRDKLLEVDGLVMRYNTKKGQVSAVEDVSFELHNGEALGLVGESGCGKTSVATALMRLQATNADIVHGQIRLNGTDLLSLSDREMRATRWDDIAMVFQGAMNAWNPVYTVFRQIEEAMHAHTWERFTRSAAREKVAELFDLVGLPADVMDRYPHQFSGGMRQRAVIAMALSCDPQLIIADEPTTALDVIVQDRILRRIEEIRAKLHMSMIYISHDLAVIAEVTDWIGVMYAGKLVELGPSPRVFARPRHPYAWSLLTSTPSIHGERRSLVPLKGEPPDLLNPPPGCRFHPRCPLATDQCRMEEPPLRTVAGGQQVACWHWDQVPEPNTQETLA
ncbi:MAG: ABC transporter ATP-binding protein [Streptosporangiales bacterium]